jgi:hypothetical protein
MTTTLKNAPVEEETEETPKKATHRHFYIPYVHIRQANATLIDHGIYVVGIASDMQVRLGGRYVCLVVPRKLSLRNMRALICDELVDYLATRNVEKLKKAIPALQKLIDEAVRTA